MTSTKPATIELVLDARGGEAPSTAFPARVGVPFARGRVVDHGTLQLIDVAGGPVANQQATLALWPDGSVRWRLFEFTWRPGAAYSVIVGEPAADPMGTTRAEPMLHLGGGSGSSEMPVLELRHRALGVTLQPELRLRHNGREHLGRCRPPESLDGGPVRWASRRSVVFQSDAGASPIECELITNTYADFPVAIFELVVRNPRAMSHPGGTWDLGAAESVLLDDLSVRFATPDATSDSRLSVRLRDAAKTVEASDHLSVFQASSGGENWDSHNHLDRHRRVNHAFRGYKVHADGDEHSGLRADPVLRASCDAWGAAIACRDFWQNFPKALQGNPDSLRVGLFPAEADGGIELQGGEQKTHTFALEIAPSDAVETIHACLEPPLVRLSPPDYAAAEALPHLTPRTSESDPRYEELVDQATDGDDSFAAKAERIDEYGWRHHGDVYGDHEAVYHRGEGALVSHYNNQYDCTLGFAAQFLRTGDHRWFDMMTRMADHAWDIDTYHTGEDKLLYNGGLFWHTYHYADADTSTHRSYPRRLSVSDAFRDGRDLSEMGDTGRNLQVNYAVGGGPAASHNYNTGWMTAYYLTGARRYRDAAINAADYVLAIEDGRRTPYRFLSRADTGYSTCSAAGYYGPGRAAANSTHALLTGFELTGNEKYTARAARLMRRTVHPHQDLDRLDLLNAELRWFYTMYLQALGRFVDLKESYGQFDADHAYGVAALLHYANWMARCERATLSRPELLQYPTETWAAQDIRKWHVLDHAARFETDSDKRQRMQEQADYFFEYVVEYLTASPTKSLCRPVVLMLNFGWQRKWFRENRGTSRATRPAASRHGDPVEFVPQRAIALRRFKATVAACAVAAALGLATLLVVAVS